MHVSMSYNRDTMLLGMNTHLTNTTVNGMSPGRHQSIFWTNAKIFLIGPLSCAKWRSFCRGLNVLKLGCGWVITSQNSMFMQLREHTINLVQAELTRVREMARGLLCTETFIMHIYMYCSWSRLSFWWTLQKRRAPNSNCHQLFYIFCFSRCEERRTQTATNCSYTFCFGN